MTSTQQSNTRLFISAPRKSSGKTTVTLGISAALVKEKRSVRVFKKGADYIDPMWHRASTGNTCHNLDLHMMSEKDCLASFDRYSSGMDFSIIEGNHGLYDGVGINGEKSSAHLAKLLDAPVLLVVDATGCNRGIAATVLGHINLDPSLKIAGVVLNQVANRRQEKKQREAIEHYCKIPVVGALPKSTDYQIKERHLGLLTVHESDIVEQVIASAADAVLQYCDIEKIKKLGAISPWQGKRKEVPKVDKHLVDIAVAYDKSFCFYYPENLEALERAGARLRFFDTMNDTQLPTADGIYIGGGFPESFLKSLEKNINIRTQIKKAIEAGVPTYAECGGLMYLTRSINRDNVTGDMVGVIPADVQFYKKPVGHGYSNLKTTNQSWLNIDREIQGHEFHYSELVNIPEDMLFAYRLNRGCGVDKVNDGIVYKNLIASYTHLHALTVPEWAPQFVSFINAVKQS